MRKEYPLQFFEYAPHANDHKLIQHPYLIKRIVNSTKRAYSPPTTKSTNSYYSSRIFGFFKVFFEMVDQVGVQPTKISVQGRPACSTVLAHIWSPRRDSNPQLPHYKCGTLPIELRGLKWGGETDLNRRSLHSQCRVLDQLNDRHHVFGGETGIQTRMPFRTLVFGTSGLSIILSLQKLTEAGGLEPPKLYFLALPVFKTGPSTSRSASMISKNRGGGTRTPIRLSSAGFGDRCLSS